MIIQRGSCVHTAKLKVYTMYEYILSLAFID